MKTKNIFYPPFFLSLFFLVNCSNEINSFSKTKVEQPLPPKTNPETIGTKATPPPATGEFFQAGRSLDLYVILDNSGSLYRDSSTSVLLTPGRPAILGIPGIPTIPVVQNGLPQVPQQKSGSDPDCKRLSALLDMIDALRAKASAQEEVRLNVVTFGSGGKYLGSFDSVLKEKREKLGAKLQREVCENNNYESTMYTAGINYTLAVLKSNKTKRKLDLETVLFFSDGAAKDDEDSLRESIIKLNKEFPKRIYGVLLGETPDHCNLTADNNKQLTTKECLTAVAGNDPDKVLSASDASQLSERMISLLEK
jgi:hypothetical protein